MTRWILLFILAGGVLLLALALRSRKGRYAVLLLGGLLPVVAVLTYSAVRVQSVRVREVEIARQDAVEQLRREAEQATRQTIAAELFASAAAPLRADTGPLDGNADPTRTDALEPDLFPTLKTAVARCALHLMSRHGEVADEENVRVVELSGARGGSLVLTEATAALQKMYSWVEIDSVPPAGTQPASAEASRLRMIIRAEPVAGQPEKTAVSGRLIGQRGQVSYQTRAVEKPWVEGDLAAWRKLQPSPSERRNLIIAPGMLASLPEVRENTLSKAADQIVAQVAARMRQNFPDASALRDSVQRDLRRGSMIADEFLQTFERPYGTVYRYAVLLDVSDSAMNDITTSFIRERARDTAVTAQHRRQIGKHVGSAIGVAAVILVVYLFLNAATKGYYVWSLRVGGTVLLLAGVVTVLALA